MVLASMAHPRRKWPLADFRWSEECRRHDLAGCFPAFFCREFVHSGPEKGISCGNRNRGLLPRTEGNVLGVDGIRTEEPPEEPRWERWGSFGETEDFHNNRFDRDYVEFNVRISDACSEGG